METQKVSILILLDYLFLYGRCKIRAGVFSRRFQSLFYWITYSYEYNKLLGEIQESVSILILLDYLFL